VTGFADVFAVPTPDFTRGRYGRPRIPQLDGTVVEYLRPSVIGSYVVDSEGLRRWDVNRTARAVAAAAWNVRHRIHTASESAIGGLVENALRTEEESPAERGTAWHTAVETGTPGRDGHAECLEKRAQLLADTQLYDVPEFRERLVVDDLRQTAGRWDGLVRCPEGFEVVLGTRAYDLSRALVVADDKTGRSGLRWGKRGGVSGGEKTSVQLTAYSRSTLYDPVSHVRTPVPGLSQDVGLIIHTDLPARRVRLVWVELNEARLISCLILARSKTNLMIEGDSACST
jgi:hypothetical protein